MIMVFVCVLFLITNSLLLLPLFLNHPAFIIKSVGAIIVLLALPHRVVIEFYSD